MNHLDQWAALELDGLRKLARDADDEVWLGWLLPPGTSVAGSAGPAIPKNAGDAVRRIGSGLDGAVLSPLGFAGLLSAYGVLGVLAHSNYLGAAILAEQLGVELSDRLAAVATHLAAAGATAVTFALAGDGACLAAATTQFEVVVHEASEIHGLPAQTSSPQRRLPHSRQARPVTAESSISRMPSAPPEMTELGLWFLEAASNLASVVASEEIEVEEGCEWISYQSFRLSLSNLRITSEALTGTLGKALLPISARMLVEDGARWNWLPHSATTATTGESLKALVTDGTQPAKNRVRPAPANGHPNTMSASNAPPSGSPTSPTTASESCYTPANLTGRCSTHSLRPNSRRADKLHDDAPAKLRLIVRRTRLLGAQGELWPNWRHHCFVTDREDLDTCAADANHRAHATVELAIRDLKEGSGLSRCPSRRFPANGARLACCVLAHNLIRWTARLGRAHPARQLTVAATIRNRLLTVPGRLVNHSGRHRLRLPLNWPWQNTFTTALQRIRNLPLLI